MALSTKIAVILAGAMWLGICAGLAVAARAATPPCYDAMPGGGPGATSPIAPGMCVDYTSPVIIALAVPGAVALIVGLALPAGPGREVYVPNPY